MVLLGAGRRGEPARPPRGHLLEQCHVPVPPGEQRPELALERAPRRRPRTTVEQVPAEHPHVARHATRPLRLLRLTRHFLTGDELTAGELTALLDRADELKAAPLESRALEGRSVALIFEKPSTRTRLSFEAGVFELGGQPIVLRQDDLQITRGETLRDTALVLSRQVSAVGIRTGPHATAQELAAHADVPVVNMLTGEHHPCQALADLMTLREAFGTLDGMKVAYVGDGNNVARSLAVLCRLAGVELAVASPPGYELETAPGRGADRRPARPPPPAPMPSTRTSG